MVGSVHRRGQQNAKMQHLRCLWTLPNDSKHNEASFSTISTDILYLRVAQMPRSPDPAIFVLTTDTTDHFTPCACARDNNNDDTTDYFTPCACARGNNIRTSWGMHSYSVCAA